MTETTETTSYDEIELVFDYGAFQVTMPGSAPAVVSWSPEVLMMLEAGGCWWCSLDEGVITMRVVGGPVRYRLTGETDLTGGRIAELLTDEHPGSVGC